MRIHSIQGQNGYNCLVMKAEYKDDGVLSVVVAECWWQKSDDTLMDDIMADDTACAHRHHRRHYGGHYGTASVFYLMSFIMSSRFWKHAAGHDQSVFQHGNTVQAKSSVTSVELDTMRL